MEIKHRDIPGHFTDATHIGFFLHCDLVEEEKASYCISLIGEWRDGWKLLNAFGETYEVLVIDSERQDVEWFYTSNKETAIKAYQDFIVKYTKIMMKEEMVKV